MKVVSFRFCIFHNILHVLLHPLVLHTGCHNDSLSPLQATCSITGEATPQLISTLIPVTSYCVDKGLLFTLVCKLKYLAELHEFHCFFTAF